MVLLFVLPLSPFFLLHSLLSLCLNTSFYFFAFPLFLISLFSLSCFFTSPSFNPSILFYISASPQHHSDSFLLCFTLLHGQVAEQLAYYVHVSETVITEETFDVAVQFGTVRGDPTLSCAG